ncbi:MAG TPA: hypothetical protein DCQ99_03825 [Nitrospinae bacterium]|nr:hypothetical protein [Nitrospinota bacterium]HBA25801.1 hypothetical protein [Nitrospinota bacterium]
MKKISVISSITILVFIALFIYLFKPHSPTPNKELKSFALPSPEDIIKDEETGLLIVKDVIMITFTGDTTQSTIDDIIKGINGKIIGYDKEHNLYQVKVAGANLKDIQSKKLELMTKHRQIEVAMIQTVSAAKNPGWQNRDSNSTATEQFSSMANPE